MLLVTVIKEDQESFQAFEFPYNQCLYICCVSSGCVMGCLDPSITKMSSDFLNGTNNKQQQTNSSSEAALVFTICTVQRIKSMNDSFRDNLDSTLLMFLIKIELVGILDPRITQNLSTNSNTTLSLIPKKLLPRKLPVLF